MSLIIRECHRNERMLWRACLTGAWPSACAKASRAAAYALNGDMAARAGSAAPWLVCCLRAKLHSASIARKYRKRAKFREERE